MDIILVRHGKAQDRALGYEDFNRELVQAGALKTAKALDFLKERLNKSQQLILYTSPAARALQTAQLLAEGLGHRKDLIVMPGIYTGEVRELFDQLSALPEDSCALVVGHEPDLGAICQRFSGRPVSFKTSGMACLRRSSSQPLLANLLWCYRAEAE